MSTMFSSSSLFFIDIFVIFFVNFCILIFIHVMQISLVGVACTLFLNDSLFEGDIVTPVPPMKPKLSVRNAVKDVGNYTWPNGVVPYYLDKRNLGAIFDVIYSYESYGLPILFEVFDELQRETCIKFREKVPGDRNFLFVTNLGGCWSFVGRQDDRPDGQELSLGPLCWEKATVSHEVMHSLGFFHEHSRFDRDDYIDINLNNVELKHWNQFDKRSPDETDLLTDYDYTSILHYHAYAWAKDKTVPTIKAKKQAKQIGQRHTFSAMDFQKINRLYHCFDKIKIDSDTIQNVLLPMPIEPKSTTLIPPLDPQPLPLCDTYQFCHDLDPLCPSLAMQGWCEMMPGKMLADCKRSCCNCYNTRCLDTTVQYYWKNYCFSGNYYDGFKQKIVYYPVTCFSPYTRQSAYDFCPKMCNKC